MIEQPESDPARILKTEGSQATGSADRCLSCADLRAQLTTAQAALGELTSALEAITAACEFDCGGTITDTLGDDESVGSGGNSNEEMALTFGMMRRARALLQASRTVDAVAAPVDSGNVSAIAHSLDSTAVTSSPRVERRTETP